MLNLGGILLMFVALWRFPDRIARINNRLFGISTGEAQSTFFGLFLPVASAVRPLRADSLRCTSSDNVNFVAAIGFSLREASTL